jgi:signal peptidase I
MTQQKVIKTKDLMDLVIESLNNNQDAVIKVLGSSMEPFFKNGITDVTIQTINHPLKKHDIILFKYENTYKLHRIIKIKDQIIYASGDNLLSKEVISTDQVIGIIKSFKNHNQITSTSSISYKLKYKIYLLFKPIIIRLKRR